jgi:5-methylcytosine-specific restriction enzyme A
MAVISAEQISAAYDIGNSWLNGSIGRSHAVKSLSEKHGLNSVSAGDLLQVLKSMIDGGRFTRSISAPAADIFLSNMHTKGSPFAAQQGITAIEKHIEYYESIRPVTLHKMRKVVGKWKALLNSDSFTDAQNQFEREVSTMLELSVSERIAKLPLPGSKPKFGYSQVKTFYRSAAVVAEVRLRAGGKCESCHQTAPFLRAQDGQPYLEVHHIVKLADNGEDTVENAIAVCPNCHRFHHYG